MDSLPNGTVPKPPLLSKVLGLFPTTGPLGQIRSLLSAVWRVGGPIQAVRLAWQVIRKTGLGSLIKLLRNASNAATQGVQLPYEPWAKRFLDLSESQILNLKNQIHTLNQQPKISILMPTYNSPIEFLQLAIKSVQNQIYQNWELCIADDASTDESCRRTIELAAQDDSRIKFVFRDKNGQISEATNSCLELATGEYVTFLDHDDELTIDALALMAIYAKAHPGVAFFYSDEDKIDASGTRSTPHFKPELNRILALSMNYFCHLSMYRTSVVRELGGLRSRFDGAQDYDLALRMLDALEDSQILHIPYVLYHWRTLPQSTSSDLSAKPYALEASRAAVREHVERQGLSASVTANPNLPIFNRVTPQITGTAKVSIVIPTRDQSKVLATCVNSILRRTSYPEYEILIVNNGSVERETRDYFDSLTDPKIMILDYPEAFNYSAINNFAVEYSSGDFVCLLNNDVEVLTEDWLEQLMCFAQLPQIGAVGAKLFYPNGKIQHAGVVLGIGGLSGVAGHVHRYFPKEAHGYMGRAMVAQEYSAVTGACLLISKEKYLEVGGLTEELAVGFNDVDFCLKLLSVGYKNVFTPHSQLTHFESLSRGADISKEQIWRASEESLYMIAQWKPLLENDPGYNRHLTAEFDDFSLAWPPRKSNGVY